MKHSIKIVIAFMILSLSFIINEEKTYAYMENTDVDSLIQHKEYQKSLKNKISNLENQINEKRKYIEEEDQSLNSGDTEVVSISFVDQAILENEEKIENEIEFIEQEKSSLEKQLEDSIIEEARLEKTIEENKKLYLTENNLDFISGIWPVPSHTDISSPFGERIHPITGEKNFHRGIDIPAPQNTDIIATDDGVVIFSGIQNGYGNVVKIKHFDGKKSVYAHNTSNLVKEGDIVKQGQVIAKVGTTGNSTGNHLHFETIVDDENINPINAVERQI
ncbi:M23 family metallopeptidase [Romboutsia lituseburensis]|uniref:M23 family metallopeptidase n=1 Tax=Romboutsia lituseburensis TaxID=1537 RepID=UPI00215B497B|nr:M23 family metallopeptidase [Romboutsia lituseburensis]MCR8745072.1 M23 family metallopeptidase [Romboutsia lituseburensis]